MGVTVSAFRPLTFATTFIYSARVTPLNSGTDSFTGNPNASSRPRDSGEPGRAPAAGWPYRHGVTETANARKIAFATFVRRALDEARATRAWSGTEVSRRTGVSRQTINRWVRGDWASDPEAERVVAFCEGLGLNPAAAFAALGWDRAAAGPAHRPARPSDGPRRGGAAAPSGRSAGVGRGEVPHPGNHQISRIPPNVAGRCPKKGQSGRLVPQIAKERLVRFIRLPPGLERAR